MNVDSSAFSGGPDAAKNMQWQSIEAAK